MRRNFRNEVRLKYLSQSGFWPSGNPRWYFKQKRQKSIAMPDAPKDCAIFLAAYGQAAGTAPTAKPKNFPKGSLGAGITAYLGSANFLRMAVSSKERWRARCDDFRLRYGEATLENLTPRHIKIDLANFDGHSANNRLKVWRSLSKYWDQKGMIETNVALQVAPRETPKTEGFAAWDRDDFATFRSHWPIGTKERLAFELMYRTCASIGDACQLSRTMISNDGWLTYTRQKSGSLAVSPFFASGPEWFEATDDLRACIDQEALHVVFLTTKQGKPRSPKGASQWFSKAATAAGLDSDKTAHGIRKCRSALFKENGAPVDKRMAVLGHETEKEAVRYSRSADLRKIIEGTEKFQLSEQVPTQIDKPLKTKGKNHG